MKLFRKLFRKHQYPAIHCLLCGWQCPTPDFYSDVWAAHWRNCTQERTSSGTLR